MSRTKSPFGKLTKKESTQCRKEVSAWLQRNAENVSGLNPSCRAWFDSEVSSLFDRIDAQDYFFAIQSVIKHIAVQVRRMLAGEITSATWSNDGSSFELKRG
jgi:hypothetical protein